MLYLIFQILAGGDMTEMVAQIGVFAGGGHAASAQRQPDQ